MKIANVFLVSVFALFSAAAIAQPPEGGEGGSTATKKAGKAPARTPYREFTMGLILWQEDIKATRGSESVPVLTQSLGLNFGMTWNKFFTTGPWRQWHTADLTIGQVKGQGGSANIRDELKRQPFYMVQGAPGLMWRTTPVSELGFGLPLAFRYIKWDVIKSSGLEMDKKTSFSAGLNLTYVTRFTARNSIHVTIAHQHMWNTTMWSATFNRVF